MNQQVVFLDRDGIINKKMSNDYVKHWGEFEFLPEAIPALKRLADAGWSLFVVSNQRGIARGRMTEDDLSDIHIRMAQSLAAVGVSLAGIYYCPHDNDECDCRKPKPGMLLRAAAEHALDLSKAVMIGDSESDMEAARRAGCRGILVKDGAELRDAVTLLLNEA